jgi:hypothetical protein
MSLNIPEYFSPVPFVYSWAFTQATFCVTGTYHQQMRLVVSYSSSGLLISNSHLLGLDHETVIAENGLPKNVLETMPLLAILHPVLVSFSRFVLLNSMVFRD